MQNRQHTLHLLTLNYMGVQENIESSGLEGNRKSLCFYLAQKVKEIATKECEDVNWLWKNNNLRH